MRNVKGVSCRGCQPLHLIAMVCYAAKSLRSLRECVVQEASKAVQIFVLRFCVCDRRKFGVLLFLSAPLDRLTPIEALPHTPQGTLSLDPASPLTPGLSLRFISRYTRCWVHNSGRLCSFLISHSSFLIPHSSFLIPHSSL